MKKCLVICIFLLAALSLGAQAIELGLHAGPDIWGDALGFVGSLDARYHFAIEKALHFTAGAEFLFAHVQDDAVKITELGFLGLGSLDYTFHPLWSLRGQLGLGASYCLPKENTFLENHASFLLKPVFGLLFKPMPYAIHIMFGTKTGIAKDLRKTSVFASLGFSWFFDLKPKQEPEIIEEILEDEPIIEVEPEIEPIIEPVIEQEPIIEPEPEPEIEVIVEEVESKDYYSETVGFLRYVPEGLYQRDENPENISRVADFRMAEHLVTRKAFRAIFDFDPSYDFEDALGGEERDMLPVQQVSWYDAIAFCNKLSIAEGFEPVYWVKSVDFASLTYDEIPRQRDSAWEELVCDWTANGYRLPTEAEWMWAAMGANEKETEVNSSGYLKGYAGSSEATSGQKNIDAYAWYGANSGGKTHPVGEKLPNALGLYDMSGNVWEWCWDWHGSIPAGENEAYTGAETGFNRVIRGAGWLTEDLNWFSLLYRKHYNHPFSRYYNDGFRVIRK